MLIHLHDYLTDEKNAVPAIAAALASAQDGDTVSLDGGSYELWPDGAYVGNYFISNNDSGDKPIAFPLLGRRNLTIDGEGAKLLFHGNILPFCIDKSQAITIKNLSLDYASPFYACAKILSSDRYKTVLHFDSNECGCRVKDHQFCFYSRVDGWESVCETGLSLEFECVPEAVSAAPAIPSSCKPAYFPYCGKPKDHGFLGKMYHDVQLEEIAPDTIAMHGNLGFTHTPGNYLVITHASREFPGFFLNEASDVTLSNIQLCYTSGMGVIAQMSENIRLTQVTAAIDPSSPTPRTERRLLSVNADAAHFVNCRGSLSLSHCKFTNMMDDAINIHGIYAIVAKADQNAATLTFGHFQQRGINFIRPGDKLAFIAKHQAETLAVLTVLSSELRSPDELIIQTDGEIPTTDGVMIVENLSTAPEISITDCEFGHNRPRGVLLSSRGKTLVERCRFYNMNAGVQIGCEMKDWYESSAVSDVLIRDCDFSNSAYAGGVALYFAPKLESMPDTYFHGRIVVENCRFSQANKRILSANLIRELIFRHNTFHADPTLPPHPQFGENGMLITNCGSLQMEELTEIS